ncbi:hypothetical protein [Allobranchiibius huperziae]|uniref:Uncharacterized protein n=1 Tax=Allobranchiibius huperziae TaxID=1874116 RepID=A0A853DB92_9MICO|nr:hypothetical protein [Allobranchiibius huperziae]NYJ73259.1 hypothetical protein [Allobranchiibius huperziae]
MSDLKSLLELASDGSDQRPFNPADDVRRGRAALRRRRFGQGTAGVVAAGVAVAAVVGGLTLLPHHQGEQTAAPATHRLIPAPNAWMIHVGYVPEGWAQRPKTSSASNGGALVGGRLEPTWDQIQLVRVDVPSADGSRAAENTVTVSVLGGVVSALTGAVHVNPKTGQWTGQVTTVSSGPAKGTRVLVYPPSVRTRKSETVCTEQPVPSSGASNTQKLRSPQGHLCATYVEGAMSLPDVAAVLASSTAGQNPPTVTADR